MYFFAGKVIYTEKQNVKLYKNPGNSKEHDIKIYENKKLSRFGTF